MKVLALIPARGGSKGVPRKNIKLLAGIPLISYTIRHALNSKLITDVIVSSEDDEIIKISKDFGANVPFVRPTALADDAAKSIDVIIHCLDYLKSINKQYDLVCLLQPTYPFRNKNLIDDSIKKYISSNADSLVSVVRVPDHYNSNWQFKKKGKDLIINCENSNIKSRRQDLDERFIRDGAIYLSSTNLITDKKTLFGEHLSYYINSELTYINIDTPADWIKAEKFISKHKNFKEDLYE